MSWISVNDKTPLTYNPVLVCTCPMEKPWTKQYEKAIFIARYCHCSGWKEEVSNPFMGMQYENTNKKCDCVQRCYFDHLHIRIVTHWQRLPSIYNYSKDK